MKPLATYAQYCYFNCKIGQDFNERSEHWALCVQIPDGQFLPETAGIKDLDKSQGEEYRVAMECEKLFRTHLTVVTASKPLVIIYSNPLAPAVCQVTCAFV